MVEKATDALSFHNLNDFVCDMNNCFLYVGLLSRTKLSPLILCRAVGQGPDAGYTSQGACVTCSVTISAQVKNIGRQNYGPIDYYNSIYKYKLII